MTNEEFINGALRTDIEDYGAEVFQNRFLAENTIHTFRREVEMAITHGVCLDKYKKHFFYGRPINVLRAHADPLTLEQKQNLLAALPLLHAAIGLYTEATEIFKALHDHIFVGAPLDITNLIEEGGDLFWYLAVLASACNTTFERMQELNNAKLRVRYPDKFSEQHAVTRDLDRERKVLEGTEVKPAASVSGADAAKVYQFCHTDLMPDTIQKLIGILQLHCGEHGGNEGATETLQRIIRERDEAIECVTEAIEQNDKNFILNPSKWLKAVGM